MSLKQYLKRGLEYVFQGVPIKHVTAEVTSLGMNELLKGRGALITGGGSGIGYSMAQRFVKSGAYVVITGRNEDKLKKTCADLNSLAGGVVVSQYVLMDVMDMASIEKSFLIVKEISKRWKQIDILVNNAGIMGTIGISSTTEESFDAVLSTNLKGTYFLSKIFGQYMKDNGIKGNILNVASSSSLRPANSAYGISKWAIRGLTLGLAKSLLPYGIVVNGIAPGPTATKMVLNESGNIERKGLLGRYIMPEEISSMAVILVSGIGRSVVGDIVYMTEGCGVITYDDIPCVF